MKKIFILIFLILFTYQLKNWFSCHDFKPAYHFFVSELKLASDNLIHNDIGMPFSLVRFYHNKITLFITYIYTSYLLFWDIKFLVNLLLITGIVGLFCGFFYGYETIRKKVLLKLLVFLMIIFPLIEIILKPAIPFPIKITLFSLPYEIFSLFGIVKFMETNKRKYTYFFLILLILLTIWWQLVLPQDFHNFCM